MPIRVVLVDDHPVLRAGVTAAFDTTGDIVVVGDCADGSEVSSIVDALHPDVVIMDLRMPGMNGADATRLVLADAPACRVIILTAATEGQLVREAMRAGASSCVYKGSDIDTLISAVRGSD